jgi:hypothetical protein
MLKQHSRCSNFRFSRREVSLRPERADAGRLPRRPEPAGTGCCLQREGATRAGRRGSGQGFFVVTIGEISSPHRPGLFWSKSITFSVQRTAKAHNGGYRSLASSEAIAAYSPETKLACTPRSLYLLSWLHTGRDSTSGRTHGLLEAGVASGWGHTPSAAGWRLRPLAPCEAGGKTAALQRGPSPSATNAGQDELVGAKTVGAEDGQAHVFGSAA